MEAVRVARLVAVPVGASSWPHLQARAVCDQRQQA